MSDVALVKVEVQTPVDFTRRVVGPEQGHS